jgi:integrase
LADPANRPKAIPTVLAWHVSQKPATLLLDAGVPWHVVQKRLGHKDASTTLDVYSHVLPNQQRDAARRLAALLHRK